jgi:hypothetical protein
MNVYTGSIYIFREWVKKSIRFLKKQIWGGYSRNQEFLILKYSSFLSLFVFYFFQTYGSLKLTNLSSDGRSRYFSAQAQSFLTGDWSVQPTFAQGECLTYTNDCRAYYGIFPSIIRIPLILMTNVELNPLFNLTAYAICILGSYKIITSISEYLSLTLSKASQFLLGLCLITSPVIFLAIRGYMYEEALLWGIALLSLTYWQLILYWSSTRKKHLYLAVILATCTLHSRVIEGVMAFAAIALSLLIQRNILKNFKAVLSLFLGFVSLPVLNFMKFGIFVPSMKFHETYLRVPYLNDLISNCGDLRVTRIPYEVLFYFFPNFHNLFNGFAYSPNKYIFYTPLKDISYSCIEQSEYFSPITITYPLLSLLATLGFFVVIQRYRAEGLIWALIISYACGLVLLFSFVGMTQRYISEFYLLFLFLGTIFLTSLPKVIKGNIRAAFLLFILLGIMQSWQAFWSILNFWTYWLDRPIAFNNLIQFFN